MPGMARPDGPVEIRKRRRDRETAVKQAGARGQGGAATGALLSVAGSGEAETATAGWRTKPAHSPFAQRTPARSQPANDICSQPARAVNTFGKPVCGFLNSGRISVV